VRGHAGSGPAANASRAPVTVASCQRADGTEHAARLSDLKTLTNPERDEGTLMKGGTSHMAKKAAKKAAKKTAKKR
jgi:hypothetical protein